MPAKPQLSYRQVTVAGLPAGLNGLDEIFESLCRAGRGAEEALGLELVRLAREQNYRPAAAERDFAIARQREL